MPPGVTITGAPTLVPTDAGGNSFEVPPPEQPGGSAVQVTIPCDSGTATLSEHPEGVGVAMTATLQHVAHTEWAANTYVTPYISFSGDPTPKHYTAHDGSLTISTTNRTGGDIASDVSYAWPQQANIDLFAGRASPNCGGSVYLGSATASTTMHNLALQFRRHSRTITLSDRAFLPGGTWQIRIDVTSPTGVHHESKTVNAHKVSGAGLTYFTFTTHVSGFTNLHDFTQVAVTASNASHHTSTWLTLTRTP